MILSRNWLDQHLNLKGIRNDEITQALNSLGFEVEKEIDWTSLNDPLVIGKVKSSQLIPETHLSLNYVDIGQKEPLQIVCGAPNVGTGQMVIIAQVGQKIANGLFLTNRQIRNYESQGMICALNEIGIEAKTLTDKENDSIYEIAPSHPSLIGKSIGEIGLHDYLWDMDLTLNRSDALAATQLLKELANYFHRKIKWRANDLLPTKGLVPPTVQIANGLKNDVETLATQTFELEAQAQAKKLTAQDDLLLKKIKVKTTDNFYEDLANLNSWETGQPLVLFDEARLKDKLTLQTITYNGKSVIALTDGAEVVTVLGLPTELAYSPTPATTRLGAIALNIKAPLMRKQQKDLNQNSTTLQRLMKPLNPNLYDYGFQNWSSLLKKYHLLLAVSPLNIVQQKYVKTTKQFRISLQKIQDFLGIQIDFETIKNLFEHLDSTVTLHKNNVLVFEMDPNRVDLFGTNDIIEEIARLYGYDNIPAEPLKIIPQVPPLNLKANLIEQTQEYLLGRGLMNVKTYALVNKTEAQEWNIFNLPTPLGLMAPLSQNHEIYRSSLIPSLIQVAQFNAANGIKKGQIWEVSDIYSGVDQRQKHLGLLVTGSLWDEPLVANKMENNFYYLKGLVETILDLYQLPKTKVKFVVADLAQKMIHPFVQAKILVDNQLMGYILRLNPLFEQQKKLHPTFVAELNLEALWKFSNHKITLNPQSKFQSSTRDLSIILSEKFNFQESLAMLTDNLKYLVNWKLIDIYRDEELINRHQQALTISFQFNSFDKQLTESEINEVWNELLSRAEKMGGQIR
ncbi:phenylalanyl-tRNA synthetase beta subunit [Entomoplasma freundtii]|uniref:Phenylalanine--tRNA ligase beta subunit n=1 Tax=Entomoplasma freundtii TaxID=74700 RepID=A0A2K8NRQ7_9MOLU|nr:phenylalanine--tRNA ligase subunit beta [Entomoplasma freundtii]ATZ16520.1 phenylalanyl-tRNA synthetase subunit beta [Entomoplasma freundtii]TDY56050.1 phenylalanyl-tRNA synthetase beta subunit [Entomoplasma freundtii]